MNNGLCVIKTKLCWKKELLEIECEAPKYLVKVLNKEQNLCSFLSFNKKQSKPFTSDICSIEEKDVKQQNIQINQPKDIYEMKYPNKKSKSSIPNFENYNLTDGLIKEYKHQLFEIPEQESESMEDSDVEESDVYMGHKRTIL